jgi:hypothetical protein
MNLEELRQGFSGRKFGELIAHHLKRQSAQKRAAGLLGTVEFLPEIFLTSVESWIDRWNAVALRTPKLWYTDCATVFDKVTQDAATVLKEKGIQYDDETLFNMFQIVVLNFAYTADVEPQARKKMGIRKTLFSYKFCDL